MLTLVRYYRITNGRNAGIAVVFGDWPERVRKHRGWTPERCVCLTAIAYANIVNREENSFTFNDL